MHLSAFNLYVENFPGPHEWLIHNTFSGAYVVMGSTALDALRRHERGEELGAADLALLGELDEWTDPDVGIVVPSLEEEQAEYKEWFMASRTQRSLHSIVAVNMACNFACPYCCQADIMDGAVMTAELGVMTADWMARRALELDMERVHITFVGGEPLLHPERIKAIAARLAAALDERGIELTVGLITNGYFLTPEAVQELLPYGLTVAQVTLDGDETTHQVSRVSKKSEDTFQRIFDNAVAASRHIRVSINGNYQEHTVHGFAPLVDKLADHALPPGSSINFSPALEILSASKGSVADACNWSSAPYEYQVALHDRIVARGFSTSSLYEVGPCGFHDYHLFVIDHRGNIFKCPGFLGHPEWRIGHVDSGLTERYQQMLSIDLDKTCGGCAHRPNCAGGCVADEMLRTGQPGANCELPFFTAMQPHAVPRQYLLAQSGPEHVMSQFPEPPVALPRSNDRGVRSKALRTL